MPEPWTTVFCLLLSMGGLYYGHHFWGRRETGIRLAAALAFGYVVPLVAIHGIGSYTWRKVGPLGIPWHLGFLWFALLVTACACADRLRRGIWPLAKSPHALGILTGGILVLMELQWDQTLMALDLLRMQAPALGSYANGYHAGIAAFHFAVGYHFGRMPAEESRGSGWPARVLWCFLSMTLLPLALTAINQANAEAIARLAAALPPAARIPADLGLAFAGTCLMCWLPVRLAKLRNRSKGLTVS